jgi:ABC-type multidrug transport system ATPase subunit
MKVARQIMSLTSSFFQTVEQLSLTYRLFFFLISKADILCKRVGIMINGKLRCVGTSNALKDQLGLAYTIRVIFKKSETNIESSTTTLGEMIEKELNTTELEKGSGKHSRTLFFFF